MKNCIQLLALLFLITSCDDKPIKVTDSIGGTKKVIIVLDNDAWESELGDTLRTTLASPVDGLIRDEPLFDLNQIKPASFEGLLKKSRNFIQIQVSDEENIVVRKDKYAFPQTGVIITGPNTAAIARLISKNAKEIRAIFTNAEIEEKQRLMQVVRMDGRPLKERYGIDITIPQAYRYASKNDPEFMWIRRSIPEGTMDLTFYEVPYNAIKNDSNVVSQIVRVRDSVGGKKIVVNDPGIFQTEPMFSPLMFEAAIDGQFAYETRGTWEVKNMFMAGPFLNYAIYNPKKKNWLIAEGYVSAPNSEQRDYLFEIEAILKSIRFKK